MRHRCICFSPTHISSTGFICQPANWAGSSCCSNRERFGLWPELKHTQLRVVQQNVNNPALSLCTSGNKDRKRGCYGYHHKRIWTYRSRGYGQPQNRTWGERQRSCFIFIFKRIKFNILAGVATSVFHRWRCDASNVTTTMIKNYFN